MKIEILKENLKSGLSVVEKVVGKNVSLPILDNVFIGVEDTYVSLVPRTWKRPLNFGF